MADNARFADAFNYYLYGGKQMIDPDGLSPLDTTEIAVPYGDGNKVPVQKYRDLLKSWQVKTNGRVIYALLGTELESEVNYAMPVKTGLYDFIHYATQVGCQKISQEAEKALNPRGVPLRVPQGGSPRPHRHAGALPQGYGVGRTDASAGDV